MSDVFLNRHMFLLVMKQFPHLECHITDGFMVSATQYLDPDDKTKAVASAFYTSGPGGNTYKVKACLLEELAQQPNAAATFVKVDKTTFFSAINKNNSQPKDGITSLRHIGFINNHSFVWFVKNKQVQAYFKDQSLYCSPYKDREFFISKAFIANAAKECFLCHDQIN